MRLDAVPSPVARTAAAGCVGTLRPRDFFVRFGTGMGAGAHGRDDRDDAPADREELDRDTRFAGDMAEGDADMGEEG